MIRPRWLVCALLFVGCEEGGSEGEGSSTGAAESTGEPEPWWLGQFHDASLTVGSNASLLFVGNLEVRADGTATGTSWFCEDPAEVIEYGWTMAGDVVTLTGDPLLWQGGGEVESITLQPGSACDEIAVRVETLGTAGMDLTYARGATCLETTGPSCAVEVVWCDAEPSACE